MTRTVGEILADLDAMDAARIRMHEVIYARAFFQSQYDEALARVSTDLGKTLSMIRLIFPTSDQLELTDAIRQFIQGRDGLSDVPLTSSLEGPW